MKIQVPVAEFDDRVHQWQLDILKMFDNRTYRFFMINAHRRARKTTLALNILIKECVQNAGHRYIYVSSTYRACKNIIWRDPQMMKKYLPLELISKMNESELYVEFKNKSILSIHGGDDPDSLRGINAHGVIMDEAPLCKREVFEEILRPIIAQDVKRWVMFIFTPKGRNWVYEYWLKAKANPEWKIYQLAANDSKIITEVELDKIRKEIPQRTFMQEFECEFNDNATGVFKNVSECVTGTLEAPQKGYTYVTGVDLAKTVDFTVLTTLCRETRKVVDFQRFNQLEWTLQKMKIVETVRKYGSLCVVDSTGLGDPITEDLIRAGISVMPYKISHVSKKELIERLIIAIEQRLITFPSITDLTDELSAFAYDVTDMGTVRYAAPEGLHDDCVISLALAVTGLKNYIYPKVHKPITRASYKPEPVNAGIGY
jgi:phage terminase large subunit-like protein